jgi:hypothetical protein
LDKPVPLNWPDVTLIDKTTNLIASPLNHNLQDTVAEKQCKYQDLTLLGKCTRCRFRGQAVNLKCGEYIGTMSVVTGRQEILWRLIVFLGLQRGHY